MLFSFKFSLVDTSFEWGLKFGLEGFDFNESDWENQFGHGWTCVLSLGLVSLFFTYSVKEGNG